jgi:hypothetical protein
MKSFEELYTDLQDQTFDTSASGLVVFKRRINDAIKEIIRLTNGVFLDKQSTLTTTANTTFKDLPYDVGKVNSVYVTVGTTRHNPKEAPSREFWDNLHYSVQTSDTPEYWFIDNGSTGPQLGLWPRPASSSNTITVNHKRRIRDLTAANYTTGTITTTSGTTITGSGTTWTSQMIGRWLRITRTDSAASGDGEWYEIATRTSNTVIDLAKTYAGTALAAASATYIIGEMSVIPEGHEQTILDWVLSKHYLRIGDTVNASLYKSSFDEGVKKLKADYSSKTNNVVLDYGDTSALNNPNLFLTL